MLYLLRHLVAITALPGMVVIVIPLYLARRFDVVARAPAGLAEALGCAIGVMAFVIGLALFAASLYHFASHGRGTLGPWDPPRRLVVRGPYRFVRNPMISGVMFVLVAEALVLRSPPHAAWAAIAIVMNVGWIVLFEERGLAARFGEEYEEYRRHVPRFVPRMTPWTRDFRS
ncbi:MAG: methyltransferase family protein [Candidatus Binatia bacterium]